MNDKRRSLVLLAVIYLAFISLGLPDGTFGVAWPLMYQEIGAPLGLAGVVMTVGTLCTATAGFLSGWLLARVSTNTVLIASGVATASGLAALAFVREPWHLFVVVLPLGFGAGAVDAGLNGYVAKHYASRHMNWLHACWGLGATAGPLILAEVLAMGFGWRNAFGLIASIQFAMALVFVLTRFLWLSAPEIAAAEEKPRAVGTLTKSSRAAWLSPLVFFCYVSVEMTVGLWAATILIFKLGAGNAKAAAVTATYFAAIMVGRILVGVVSDRIGNARLVRLGIRVALVGLLGFALAPTAGLATAALIVIGVGLSPVYPGLMHEAQNRFEPTAVQTIVGRQTGAASLGAATVPALVGAVTSNAIFWMPACIALFGLALLASNAALERACRRPSE